jgi:hypothetical protein
MADDSAPRTDEQQELVDWALGRFTESRLDLPEVKIQFHPSSLECLGREGIYFLKTQSLQMCSLSKRTMLHELAHAWADHAMNSEERQAFIDYRGLESWNARDEAWAQRATEHIAEIIAWALMDVPIHVPDLVVDEDGTTETVYRLVLIPDSEVETLADAYRIITGADPIFRSPAEWQPRAEATSPEARFMG